MSWECFYSPKAIIKSYYFRYRWNR